MSPEFDPSRRAVSEYALGHHGLSAAIGIPSPPVAAMSISANLARTNAWFPAKRALHWNANFTWMSLALMAAVVLSLSGKPGSREAPIGWPIRLLIISYSAWVMTVAWQAIRVRGKATPPGLTTDPLVAREPATGSVFATLIGYCMAHRWFRSGTRSRVVVSES